MVTEPQQGASYDDLFRVARTAEDAGDDAFFRSDLQVLDLADLDHVELVAAEVLPQLR